MTLSPATGSPPAVTHEQVETWSKLADDVTSALTMGGEQGMDMLLSLMAEWCEAADDVNSARQVCVDLAERGLRDEAIHWHAEGFFEVADRLDPDRPGWEAWDQALRDRDVVTPRIDADLKEMANRIHDDLAMKDLSGQALADYLAKLRRNMLMRGHLGERLTILESIRGLDPAGPAWEEMVRPIRRKRSDAIGDEVRAAVARRDFESLSALRVEVASQDWGDDLPADVVAMLEASGHHASLDELRSRLSQAAAVIVGRVDDARRQGPGAARMTAITEATGARKRYAEMRQSVSDSLQAAQSSPEIAALVVESGIREALRQLDAAVRDPCGWLDQQKQADLIRAKSGDIEAALLRQIENAPAKAKLRQVEAFRTQLSRWRMRNEDIVERSRKAAARLPGGIPPTVEAAIQRVKEKEEDLKKHLNYLEWLEKMILLIFLAGFVGLIVLIIVAIMLTS